MFCEFGFCGEEGGVEGGGEDDGIEGIGFLAEDGFDEKMRKW